MSSALRSNFGRRIVSRAPRTNAAARKPSPMPALCVTNSASLTTSIDEAAEFQTRVIQYFADEYKAGRTPNPCVMCNQNLKFGRLIERADQLGAQYIATGHFARLEKSEDGSRALLKARSRSRAKTKAIFCSRCGRINLRAPCFRSAKKPRATPAKSRVIAISRPPTKKKAWRSASCRITITARFCNRRNSSRNIAAKSWTPHGQVLGHHDGIEFYTIGQRKGLGISSPKPLYVIDSSPATNRVVVSDESALDRDEFIVDRCNWIPFDNPPQHIEVSAKIRYNHPGTPATVEPLENGRAKVILHEPQRAITPGQAAVFYQDDLVVGGGWITR